MRFQAAFDNRRFMRIDINEKLTSTSHICVPLEEIANLIHDICDDLDMVRPQDMETLKSAIDRFNYLTKVED